MGIRVLIAASGSGGHLFPAIYIGRAIRRLIPDSEINFVGSGRPLEKKLVDPEFKRHEIPLAGLKRRGVRGVLEFLVLLPRAVCRIWRLLSDFKPDVIVGVGGYATFLPVTLGRLRKIPTWIHEAEVKPGLANFVLSFYSSKVSVAFENARMPRKGNVTFTGHPVREDLKTVEKKAEPD